MGRRGALLDPANMQTSMGEIDLVPAEIHQLADPQAVAISDQDHGGIAMAPAVVAGCLDQLLDLGASQMFPGSIGGIRTPFRCDCPINGCWGDYSEFWFH
jgi:hypothetical protein